MSDLHGANDGTRIQILIEGEWCESVYNYCMMKPHYPVPAIVTCQWCGTDHSVCNYANTGEWCPSLCFALN